MCSNTTFRFGTRSNTGFITRSINTASRSKISISGSVTSPCTKNKIPCAAISSNTGISLNKSVTPESELVVAPAGYSLNATMPAALASRTVSGVVLSVKYNAIKGSKAKPCGTAAKICCLYAKACSTLVTGGFKLGIISARPIWRAV